MLEKQYSPVDPMVVTRTLEVQELQKKINEMEMGTMHNSDNSMRLLIPFKQAPKLSMEYVRLYRDLSIQNKILEILTPIYEQAKVEEKRETPTVVILDHAMVPERKAKPKVTLYALIAFVVLSILALFIAFTKEGFDKLRVQYPERLSGMIDAAKDDWFGLKWNRRTK